MSKIFSRTEVVVGIAAFTGFLMILEYFIRIPELRALAQTIQVWSTAIASIALYLGLINMLKTHSFRIQRRVEGQWWLSIWLLICLAVTAIPGLLQGPGSEIYTWMFNNMFLPVETTVVALIGFWVILGTYEFLKVRNFESAVLVVCAIIMIMTVVPIGELINPMIGEAGMWLLATPASAVERALAFGVAIGLILLAFRIFLGIETRVLGGGD